MHLLLIRPTKLIAGTERFNITLLQGLYDDLSIHIELLTNSRKFVNLTKQYCESRFEYWLPEEVGTKKQLLKILINIPVFVSRYISVIKQMEKGGRFDVICLQSRTEMIFLTPILKLLGYKVSWIQHGAFFVSKTSRIVKLLYRLISYFTDQIIVVSKHTKRDLLSGGVQRNKIKVFYIGINTKKYLPIYKKLNRTLTLGFLGTVTKEKGTDDFVIIANLVKKYHFNYLVIGDGPDIEEMKSHITASFTGYVDNVMKQLKRVDILLFPTHHYEGVPIALREAGAMGIPVIASDIGGIREIITHGYNGLLYKVGDVYGMVKGIKKLAKNQNIRVKMGNNARNRILEKFDIRKQSQLLVNLFKGL